jgi:hypothetical protein
MAIAFRQLITPWSSESPAASAAFTGTAGDSILAVGGDYSNDITAFSGSGGTYGLLTPPGNVEDVDFNHNWAIGDCLSIAGGSQTITVTGTVSDGMAATAIEYSGVSTVSGNGKTVASPGTAANAITGTAVTVPTGSVLVACCIDTTDNTSATITTSGTSRGGGAGDLNTAYLFGEWAGAGGSITPEFTTTVGTDNYIVLQWLLTPASSGIVDEDPEYVIFIQA